MKIALVTHGTRGDVQPFVALALALMARGHDVWLGVPPNLMEFVRRCGVRAEPIPIDSQTFMESPEGKLWLASGNVGAFMKQMSAVFHQHRAEIFKTYWGLTLSADLIISGLLTEDWLLPFAEKFGIPMISVHLAVMRSTNCYPNVLVTTRKLPLQALNLLTHSLADTLWWHGFRDDVNEFRHKLSLEKRKASTSTQLAQRGAYTVHAFSPTLVPPPTDWGPRHPVVGAIAFPIEARQKLGEAVVDRHLAAWLQAGSKPIYFGLGSMPVERPQDMIQMVGEVTRALGVRAVIAAGWSRFETVQDLSGHLRLVGAVDHNWLLPQCQAAVHHGGAGTAFAVTSAGLPSVVCSVFADQPFWGVRLSQIGVGVHLPYKNLTAQGLEAALSQVLDARMQEASAQLGVQLRTETDAVPKIVEIVEQVQATFRKATRANSS